MQAKFKANSYYVGVTINHNITVITTFFWLRQITRLEAEQQHTIAVFKEQRMQVFTQIFTLRDSNFMSDKHAFPPATKYDSLQWIQFKKCHGG